MICTVDTTHFPFYIVARLLYLNVIACSVSGELIPQRLCHDHSINEVTSAKSANLRWLGKMAPILNNYQQLHCSLKI